MTFSAYYKNDSLTGDQRTLTESLDQFLDSSAHAFLMMGGAGTGKTFMLQKLAAYLQIRKRTVRLTQAIPDISKSTCPHLIQKIITLSQPKCVQ